MKFSYFHHAGLAAALLLSSPSPASASRPAAAGGLRASASDQARTLVAQDEEEATFVITLIENGDGTDSQVLTAVYDDGRILDIENTGSEWADGAVSGSTRIVIPAGAKRKGNGKLDLNGRAPVIKGNQGNRGGNGRGGGNLFDRALLEADGPRTPEQERNLARLRRHLAVVGTKTILAVRVKHSDAQPIGVLTAREPDYSAGVLAEEVFGTAVAPAGVAADFVNLHDQYKACSFDQLVFNPRANLSSGGSAVVSDIVDGVVEVTVSTNCASYCDGNMRSDASAALQTAFGVSASSLADHVMFCLPPGSMTGIAYAGINSWYSVYKNDWCLYPSGQMHEIGHNIGLAHSSEGGNTYGDQTGFMGYSYSSDEQKMCFNNAKSWQLGWFTAADLTIGLNQEWSGTLKGQINYVVGQAGQEPVLIKLENHLSGKNYYVGFNHDAGHNQDTEESTGRNKVTIQEYTGTGYAYSYLVAKLGATQTWTNVMTDGSKMEVSVSSITTGETTGRATVSISYFACSGPSDCDDGNDCNGIETCVNPGTTSSFCQAGTPDTLCCGNGVCEAEVNENIFTCPSDNCVYDCGTECKSLDVGFAAGIQAAGNFFKVQASQDVIVTGFDINPNYSGSGTVSVYEKEGEYATSDFSDPGAWNLVESFSITTTGGRTALPDFASPVAIAAGTFRSFYVILPSINVRYTGGTGEGNVWRENPGELIFYEGRGSAGLFSTGTYTPRVWNGEIRYGLYSAPEPATDSPSKNPTGSPTASPVVVSTSSPSKSPIASPTHSPTASPSKLPTTSPVASTSSPSKSPTASPIASTSSPSKSPTAGPTASPSAGPSNLPTASPVASTSSPSKSPTASPVVSTSSPSKLPTSAGPTASPSTSPSKSPTASPVVSTSSPSKLPTSGPTASPSTSPSKSPTASPVISTASPSKSPSVPPTPSPSTSPTTPPTPAPTPPPTTEPTTSPSTSPSKNPTKEPTAEPTDAPTVSPTTAPPTANPTASPTESPTTSPPTTSPTTSPSKNPTKAPSPQPTNQPTPGPTSQPTFPPTPKYLCQNSDATDEVICQTGEFLGVGSEGDKCAPGAIDGVTTCGNGNSGKFCRIASCPGTGPVPTPTPAPVPPTPAPVPQPTDPGPTPTPPSPTPPQCPVCGNGDTCCAPQQCETTGKSSDRACV